MPLIAPSLNTAVTGVPRVIWSGIASGDTFTPFTLTQQYGLAGSVQVTGTFSGATVVMQVSNDGTNWVTAKDVQGTNISLTSAGYAELSLSAAYIRPSISGGTATALTVAMVLRGSHGV